MSDQLFSQPGPIWPELRVTLVSFLNSRPDPVQLLALGEPTHSADLFPAWRNRLFELLVEDHGFRSVALESDILAGQQVNAYVTSGEGHVDDVMRTGFSHGFGATPANRELVAWMHAFNTGRSRDETLQFYGFDPPLEWWAPSPAASLLALHAFLEAHLPTVPVNCAELEQLLGPEAPWKNPAAVRDPGQSIGDTGEARRLRLLADDLETLLQTETPHLATQSGFWDAQLSARTATGLLRYHALMATPTPDRMARLSGLRDLMMAENLCAIREREEPRGPTLVFAHQSHLQRPNSAMQLGDLTVTWWSAGAHLSRHLGTHYAFIPSLTDAALPQISGPAIPQTGPSGSATLLTPSELAAVRAGQDGQLIDGALFIQTAPN
ncbi:erythromycin esterase [Deinococcus sp. HMF7620]|uniref:Erythromycin esterase n=1 Tax=Deinococcus arboris TaxID=2682977 RepID=A0A7C9M0E3_9DEIO|nr:erythromycin esterase family protein [Deinococcus arboris]MVN86002.1 erythromycin esterase [Deinococcus arboris]